jgi:methionyl-tRNA formyltransferase
MRIVFMGTSPFAVPSLERLFASPEHQVVAVVTQPDRPHGRGGRLSASPVKLATPADVPLLQPEKVRAKEFVEHIRGLSPDLLAVAAFGQLIPQRLLDIPKHGGINVHGSLLPRWRGAAPMQYALMAGDAETGVTTMQMDAGLDTGDILLTASVALGDEDNAGTIEPKLAEIGAGLLIDTLQALELGDCPRMPQDPSFVTYAPSLPADIGELDWNKSAVELHNLVRGLTPKPGSYGLWDGKRLKVLRTLVADERSIEAGMVKTIDTRGITVGTGKGALRLLDVQPESRSQMPAAAWGRGARITPGQRFGARVST